MCRELTIAFISFPFCLYLSPLLENVCLRLVPITNQIRPSFALTQQQNKCLLSFSLGFFRSLFVHLSFHFSSFRSLPVFFFFNLSLFSRIFFSLLDYISLAFHLTFNPSIFLYFPISNITVFYFLCNDYVIFFLYKLLSFFSFLFLT